ncbi:histone-like nucleoid-structuring protein Lsr2 [Streptomyces sp. NPDC021224]|uniref:Lsr2 family DNA-binding protein n=1 Tax=unclassified Streptomyces TaxID=2593676 RepID=UPI0037ACEE2D
MTDRTIYVATGSVLGEYDGRPLYIHQGVTTVRAGHRLLDTFGALFEPLRPMFEVDDEPDGEAQADAETEQAPETTPSAPAAADVRAWAAEQGIEVSAKGKIPQDVTDAYVAAHQGA